ncbi:hypothetical protein BJ741DRAFT_614664 [Chytriomyces cf. hyalinus JEL632]|nr:hypothetical protein BJ741DRAFT_614664 [Chytriomyces cf. hyalinus JEL632]
MEVSWMFQHGCLTAAFMPPQLTAILQAQTQVLAAMLCELTRVSVADICFMRLHGVGSAQFTRKGVPRFFYDQK